MPLSLSSLFVAGANAIGFSPAGVVAGSPAAAWQSSIGNVAPGSLFALLQSIGASGNSTAAAGSLFALLPSIGVIGGSQIVTGGAMAVAATIGASVFARLRQ